MTTSPVPASHPSTNGRSLVARPPNLRVALPDRFVSMEQDAEWFVLHTAAGWQEVRFHDYAAIYRVPGLYERIFRDLLSCNSPSVVAQALARHRGTRGRSGPALRVLDLGAGNGMVAEELRRLGAARIVGVDILQEAKEAAARDRPGAYDDYHVMDLADADDGEVQRCFVTHEINAIACVAALGFNDVSSIAFERAVAHLPVGGHLAFNIKDEFLNSLDSTGFSATLHRWLGDRTLRVLHQRRYRHRYSTAGEALHYHVVVAEKVRALSPPSGATTA